MTAIREHTAMHATVSTKWSGRPRGQRQYLLCGAVVETREGADRRGGGQVGELKLDVRYGRPAF